MNLQAKARMIVPYVWAFFISLGGVVWQVLAPSQAALILLIVLSVLPIFFLVGSMVLAKRKMDALKSTPLEEGQAFLLRHRNDAEKASQTLLSELKAMRRKTGFYALCMALCGSAAALWGGMAAITVFPLYFLGVIYGGAIFAATLTRIPLQNPIQLSPDATVLKKEDYPLLYETVEQAAEVMGCKGQVTILLSFECNASIARDRNRYYLELGILYLCILSKEELYAICLHEFSHCTDQNQKIKKELQYGEWLPTDKAVHGLAMFATNLFLLSDVNYLIKYMVYSYATSVLTETKADTDMAKHSSPEAAASALLKLSHYDKFRWEQGVEDEVPLYAAEVPNPHFLREYIEKFKNATKARQEFWDTLVQKEILPNNATHPILRMRLETLGVVGLPYIPFGGEGEWWAELDKALDFADETLAKLHSHYEKERQENYFEPLRRITEWEEKGMPISAETFADIISDLRELGRNKDALTLCDRAIAELDENASPYAYFIKGCALLHCYDEAGIDLLYHAVDANHNFIEEGLQQIGEYFCMIGDEEKLAEYRKRALVYAQKDRDEYSETGFLSPKDNLTADPMPKEMLEDILQFIRSVDEDIIENIYLVRKTVSDSFFTSAFVIHFYGGTDKQRGEIMHKIFCFLDTYPTEWQFSLFDYFDYPQIKFSKIEGSLVFSKKEKNHVN